jgi:tryptophan 2,3-dioxygenase
MAGNRFDDPYGDGASEYERYLKTRDLLALQKPPERRSHPDELLFQVIHQVEELWMKVAVHEFGELVDHLNSDRYVEGKAVLGRIHQVLGLCEHQLRLFEGMLPSAYLAIRPGLGHGSGMDSPGFNRINQLAPEVWKAYSGALERSGVELLLLHQRPETHPGLLAIAEGLVDVDGQWQRFKHEHLMVVRRIIGSGTASLRGNAIDMLERSTKLTFFPMLWAVRDRMFLDFQTGSLEP